MVCVPAAAEWGEKVRGLEGEEKRWSCWAGGAGLVAARKATDFPNRSDLQCVSVFINFI